MMNRRTFFRNLLPPPGPSPARKPRAVPKPASPAFPVVPTAGSPRQYRPGSLVYVTDSRAWLGCDSIGFYAMDAICPHLGGRIEGDKTGFTCPAHGSQFAPDGHCLAGPATRNARFWQVDLDDAGQLVIRRDQSVAPSDRFIA